MKTEQLSSQDQKRVSDALSKCAAATKSIEDSQQLADTAYGIFKESLGDNPELFKVACRVYNSCKSIHKLASAGDDDRGNSFAILDANALTDRLKKENIATLYKAASAPVTFGIMPAPAPAATTTTMRKAASAQQPAKPQFVLEKLSGAEKRAAINNVINDWESLIKEASGELAEAEREFSHCLSDFVYTLSSIPAHVRKVAAAEVYANYGEIAGEAIERFNEKKPMCKVASSDYVGKYKGTPLIQNNDIANVSERLFESNQTLLEKKAYMDRAVVECVRAMKDLFSGIRKSAGGDGLAGKALTAAVGADVVAAVPELLGYDYTDDKAKSTLADSEIENAILAAGSRRAFMKALHNDTISSYPLPQIIEAFNMAYSKLPPAVRRMPATRSQALINAEMIATLAEGNTPSKADREHLLMTMRNFDYNNPRGVMEGILS